MEQIELWSCVALWQSPFSQAFCVTKAKKC